VKRRKGVDKGKFINTWTGREVSKATAYRYNRVYKDYRKRGVTAVTLAMLYGNPMKIRKRKTPEKPWTYRRKEDYSDKVDALFRRDTQVIKTVVGGRSQFYSPVEKAIVKPDIVRKMKGFHYTICGNAVDVYLHCMSYSRQYVSHIWSWNVNTYFPYKMTKRFWLPEVSQMLDCIVRDIMKACTRYRLGRAQKIRGRFWATYYSDTISPTTFAFKFPEGGNFPCNERGGYELKKEVISLFEHYINLATASARTTLYVNRVFFQMFTSRLEGVNDLYARYRIGVLKHQGEEYF